MERIRPTLLASCARATTAAEARYRVQSPNALARTSRIFALDPGAAAAMRSISEDPWTDAHFLTVAAATAGGPGSAAANDDLAIRRKDGSPARLSDEVAGADVVVLLCSSGDNQAAAEMIAREASRRGIMVAGLALADGLSKPAVDEIVSRLRPYASVLVVASDNDYIPAMLTALRA